MYCEASLKSKAQIENAENWHLNIFIGLAHEFGIEFSLSFCFFLVRTSFDWIVVYILSPWIYRPISVPERQHQQQNDVTENMEMSCDFSRKNTI